MSTTQVLLSIDDNTSIARRAASAAKRVMMVCIPVRCRGPETIAFCAEPGLMPVQGSPLRGLTFNFDASRSAKGLLAILTGDMDLPTGKEG